MKVYAYYTSLYIHCLGLIFFYLFKFYNVKKCRHCGAFVNWQYSHINNRGVVLCSFWILNSVLYCVAFEFWIFSTQHKKNKKCKIILTFLVQWNPTDMSCRVKSYRHVLYSEILKTCFVFVQTCLVKSFRHVLPTVKIKQKLFMSKMMPSIAKKTHYYIFECNKKI